MSDKQFIYDHCLPIFTEEKTEKNTIQHLVYDKMDLSDSMFNFLIDAIYYKERITGYLPENFLCYFVWAEKIYDEYLTWVLRHAPAAVSKQEFVESIFFMIPGIQLVIKPEEFSTLTNLIETRAGEKAVFKVETRRIKTFLNVFYNPRGLTKEERANFPSVRH